MHFYSFLSSSNASRINYMKYIFSITTIYSYQYLNKHLYFSKSKRMVQAADMIFLYSKILFLPCF